MAKAGPGIFIKQVKSEAQKVSWPSRKETTQSTIAVFIMVAVASIFLYAADQIIALVISFILGIGA